MSYEAQRVAIQTRFEAQFSTSYPSVPIEYDGVDFDEPSSGDWVKISIEGGGSSQANLGITNITERFTGFVQFEIVTRKGAGFKVRNEMKEAIARIFSRVQLSITNGAITFETPEDMGHVQEEEKIVSYLRIPFLRDTRY